MAVGISGERVCTGLGAAGDGSLLLWPWLCLWELWDRRQIIQPESSRPFCRRWRICPGVLSALMKAFLK